MRRLIRALRTELQTAQDILAGAAVSMKKRSEPLTHAFLNRMRSFVTSTGSQEIPRVCLQGIDGYLAIPEATLALEHEQYAGPGRGGASLRTFALPFLASQMQRLDLLSTDSRAALLGIQQRLGIYNQLVDEATRYQFMSFTPGDNHDLITSNWSQLAFRAGQQAELLVEQIAQLLTRAEMVA